MDIRRVLRAHAEWIVHLREYVYGSGALDARIALCDDECDLGRWIYGEAARFRDLPEYEIARQAHATFHAEAAEVVRLMQAGRRHEAALAVDHGSRLKNQSAIMVRSFLWLAQRLEAVRPSATTQTLEQSDRDTGVAPRSAASEPGEARTGSE